MLAAVDDNGRRIGSGFVEAGGTISVYFQRVSTAVASTLVLLPPEADKALTTPPSDEHLPSRCVLDTGHCRPCPGVKPPSIPLPHSPLSAIGPDCVWSRASATACRGPSRPLRRHRHHTPGGDQAPSSARTCWARGEHVGRTREPFFTPTRARRCASTVS